MRRRRLLSIAEDGEEQERQFEPGFEVSYVDTKGLGSLQQQTENQQGTNDHQYSYNLNAHHPDTLRAEDGFILEGSRGSEEEEDKQAYADATSSSSSGYLKQRRSPRSLLSPTLEPPLSTLSLLYQFGAGKEHTLLPQPVPLSLQRGTSLLSPPLNPLFTSSYTSASSSSPSSSLLPARTTMNDFTRKVEGFWILRELQSWLWRSAKDFNCLKKKLRG